MISFEEQYQTYLDKFNEQLQTFCKSLHCKPDVLSQSMQYSLLLGGKRVRPVLLYAIGDLLGVEQNRLINFALALECIHTYSLIHDDMPEMDNDDFRRGKPSNHKVFGSANALLAGDALLNTAYSLLFEECFKGSNEVSASQYLCYCAGIYGMIGGQSADLLHENDPEATLEDLSFIHQNKTGKLILAPVLIPSILSNGKNYTELKLFGEKLGFLFQLVDDVLDVEGNFDELGKSIGKDQKENKFTSVRFFGLTNCKLQIDLITDDCIRVLEGIQGNTQFLIDFVYFIKNRTK